MALVLVTLAPACTRRSHRPLPAPDRPGGFWIELAGLRVLWPPSSEPPTVAPAPARAPASSAMGWRCAGSGSRQACLDRARHAEPFRCLGERCTQRHPYRPDDGEWLCGESAGSTLCTAAEAAAGVAPAPLALGWLCGVRPSGARVCVDLAPDFPDGQGSGWRCRFEGAGLPARICVRDQGNHALGDTCDHRRPCVDGALCVAGRCVPPRPAPSCWNDGDCQGGACRFGSCTGARPDVWPDLELGGPAVPAAAPAAAMPAAMPAAAPAAMLAAAPAAALGGPAMPAAAPAAMPAAAPLLDFGPPRPQLGFASEFVIDVKPVAARARGGKIAWKQISGPPLPELRASDGGFRLTGRTIDLQSALGGEAPWGVVPLSPRTRGGAVLEATWSDGQGRSERFEVTLAAAAPSPGLTTIAVGQRQYLGGRGWRIVRRADGSTAELERASGLTSFVPDRSGNWRLRDGAGRVLDLIAGRYDEVPLDCSRAQCHADLESSAGTMTTVLARLLEGIPAGSRHAARAGEYPGCALACHAIGVPGLDDGGFANVARTLGRTGAEREPWPALPRSLRRLAGVGCLACHGPGAVPDPRASWTTLRANVCATCHDDPPTYGHVAAWRGSPTARADRDPAAATQPACVRCHTTWGFLASGAGGKSSRSASADADPRLTTSAGGGTPAPTAPRPRPPTQAAPEPGPRPPAQAAPGPGPRPPAQAAPEPGPRPPAQAAPGPGLRPPAQAEPLGIACAACHDSHPPARPGEPVLAHALLRQAPLPPLLPPLPAESARRSSICLPCHTPDPDEKSGPAASAAAIWLGRGGLDPETGAALTGPAPGARLAGGCLGCHTGEPGMRGANHSFSVPADCVACPGEDLSRSDGVRARARRLYARVFGTRGNRPPHAAAAALARDTPAGRARWNLLLLAEDGAAEAHNPPYARALLESAERVLGAGVASGDAHGGR